MSSAFSIWKRRRESKPSSGKLRRTSWIISAARPKVPEEVTELENLADQYLCNFSIFQSLLDNWALGQLFPIVPVHHLNERPERAGTLVDITCDSDGKIDKFIDLHDVKNTLPLHRLEPGKPYYLGIFSDRRLPGHHGRPAQSFRPRQRGARLPR